MWYRWLYGGSFSKEIKNFVRGVYLKYPEFTQTVADEFIIGDLRYPVVVSKILFGPFQNIALINKLGSRSDIGNGLDYVHQFVTDMSEPEFVFSWDNNAKIMHNSALINLNVVGWAIKHGIKKDFIHLLLAFILKENN